MYKEFKFLYLMHQISNDGVRVAQVAELLNTLTNGIADANRIQEVYSRMIHHTGIPPFKLVCSYLHHHVGLSVRQVRQRVGRRSSDVSDGLKSDDSNRALALTLTANRFDKMFVDKVMEKLEPLTNLELL